MQKQYPVTRSCFKKRFSKGTQPCLFRVKRGYQQRQPLGNELGARETISDGRHVRICELHQKHQHRQKFKTLSGAPRASALAGICVSVVCIEGISNGRHLHLCRVHQGYQQWKPLKSRKPEDTGPSVGAAAPGKHSLNSSPAAGSSWPQRVPGTRPQNQTPACTPPDSSKQVGTCLLVMQAHAQ